MSGTDLAYGATRQTDSALLLLPPEAKEEEEEEEGGGRVWRWEGRRVREEVLTRESGGRAAVA
eukprot:3465224-Rhodomonas_salina.2